MSYLDKKIILATIIILLVLGGWFLVFKDKSSKDYENKISLLSSLTNSKEMNKDSDNDGLKDWEEALWKTDPENPDTDNDGTSDGEEVKNNRNPLVPGPSDSLFETIAQGAEETNIDQESFNLTGILGRQFFAEYLTLKQSGAEIGESTQAELINSFLTNLAIPEPNDAHTLSDVKTYQPKTKEEIKEYGNNLGLIIKRHFDAIPETELTIFNNALANENESELEKLNPLILAYKNTAIQFLELGTPQNLSKDHLKIINTFQQISKQLTNMKKVFADPVLAIASLKQYQKTSQEAYTALQNIHLSFLGQKIAFTEGEPGQLFEIYAIF